MDETSQNLHKTIETFIQTAQFDTLIDTCRIALAEAREREDRLTEILALIGLAKGHVYIGKFREARILIDGAIDYSAQLREPDLIVMALDASGTIFISAAFQAYEAERDYRHALRIASEMKDEQAIVSALNGLSLAYLQVDDTARAARYARTAFDMARDNGNRYQMCIALMMLGNAYLSQKPDKAMQAFEDAMAIAQEDNYRLLELGLTGDIGELLQRENRYADEGFMMLEKTLAMAKDFRSVPHEFSAMHRLARALEKQQSYDRAALYYSNMLERAQEWRARPYEAVAFFNLGILAYNRLHFDDAIANLAQSLAIAREIKNPYQEAQSEQVLGASYLAMRDYDQALDHLMAARSLYASLDNHYMTGIMLQRIIIVYFQRLFATMMRWLGVTQPDESNDDH